MSRPVLQGWIGLLGPPVLWAAQFEARYAIAGRTTGPGHPVAQGAVGVAALILIIGCGIVGRRAERGSARSLPFLSIMGRWCAAGFALATIAQLLPVLFISPWAV